MKNLVLFVLFSFLFFNKDYGQQLFHNSIFRGGITTRLFTSWDTSSTSINIPNSSTIIKAYLISGNQIDSNFPITINLNGNSITLNNSSQISNRFNAPALQSSGSVHAIDITSLINVNTQIYTLDTPITAGTYPSGENQNPRFWNYCLYIAYKNDSLPLISSSIYLNNLDVEAIVNYNINNLNPIDTSNSVGLSFLMGHMISTPADGSFIYLNNTDSIGLVYGGEIPTTLSGAGVLGQFDYYNDTLYGYGDDTPDSLMNGADALADISSYLPNGATNLDIRFEYASPNITSGVSSNPVWATFLTYTTPCDTFSTNINIADTLICGGESVTLVASGGANYQWEVFGTAVGNGSSLTLTPSSSASYIVKITDTNGCMKTEMAHVVVNPIMAIGGVATSPTVCKDSTGSITLQNTSGGIAFFGTVYQNSINGVNNTNIWSEEYSNLAEGSYTLAITDLKGCTATTMATVGSYINTVAQFSANPQSGEAPLNVAFTNQSSNASNYTWYINNEESPAFAGESYTFDSVGVYEITLYAYGNDSTCVDSANVLINVVSPFRVFIPTFYDANQGSLYLDTRGCKTVTLEIFDEIGKLIYVEKKTVTDGQNEFWKGYNARGIYLYRIFAEGIDGTKLEQGGKLVLMR